MNEFQQTGTTQRQLKQKIALLLAVQEVKPL